MYQFHLLFNQNKNGVVTPVCGVAIFKTKKNLLMYSIKFLYMKYIKNSSTVENILLRNQNLGYGILCVEFFVTEAVVW